MKRLRKMTQAKNVTQQVLGPEPPLEVRRALIEALPVTLFGKTIGAQVLRVDLVEDRLILKVPDDTWRKELSSRQFTILGQAQKILPMIASIEIGA